MSEMTYAKRGNGKAIHIARMYGANGDVVATACDHWATNYKGQTARLVEADGATCKKCLAIAGEPAEAPAETAEDRRLGLLAAIDAGAPLDEWTAEEQRAAAHADLMQRIDEKLAVADAALDAMGYHSCEGCSEPVPAGEELCEACGEALDAAIDAAEAYADSMAPKLHADQHGEDEYPADEVDPLASITAYRERETAKANAAELVQRHSLDHERAAVAAAEARSTLIDSVRKGHELGLSEYQLAELVGVQRSTIRAWLGK